ncbi:hypothetical protein MC885_018750, partial [Smutsia gigantea]
MFHLQEGGLQRLLGDGVEGVLDLGQDGAPVLGAPGLPGVVQTQVALGDAAVTRVRLLQRGLARGLCPLGQRLHGLGLGHLVPVLALPARVSEAGPALALGAVAAARPGAQALGTGSRPPRSAASRASFCCRKRWKSLRTGWSGGRIRGASFFRFRRSSSSRFTSLIFRNTIWSETERPS